MIHLVNPSSGSASGAITTSGLTMSTGKVLGRTTAGTGAIEEISPGTSLSLSGTTLNTIQGIRTTDTPQFARLGIGGAADATHLIKIALGTVTADTHAIDITGTWNNSGVTFTAVKINITKTAANASSPLLDMQVGGTSKFSYLTDGSFLQRDSSGNYLGVYSEGNVLNIINASSSFRSFAFNMGNGMFALGSGGGLVWSTNSINYSGVLTSSIQASIFSDNTGIIVQRNSTTAQTLRVANTWTNASNYEYGVIDWTTTANTLTIGAQAAGTGTLRQVQLVGASIKISDIDIVLNTTTGTKIGTATTQKLAFYNSTPVVQQTDGAALTNNVTSGGTDNTIANFTDLTVYANDAAAIRNDIYQLARKVKIIGDALRTYGLLS